MNDTNPQQEQEQKEKVEEQEQQKQKSASDWWKSTRKTLDQASSTAVRYKQMVQKKIDLAATRKKIDQAHAELGRKVDQARENAAGNPLDQEDVRQVLTKLDNLKQSAIQLEEEINALKEEKASATDSNSEQ
jgi:multidrug resistance efflux pump